jgi:homoserine O-acetyltransferase
VSPFGEGGRFSIESYLDFHGNKFTRRFDANSYIILAEAMNTHDVGRDRGGAEKALSEITTPTLVLGISSDRLFPVENQKLIADHIGGKLVGGSLQVIDSEFGHDGFLIEKHQVGAHLKALLEV